VVYAPGDPSLRSGRHEGVCAMSSTHQAIPHYVQDGVKVFAPCRPERSEGSPDSWQQLLKLLISFRASCHRGFKPPFLFLTSAQ
ncbi:hypothetical protein, partial [Legionella maceachernii]|uniref:hypothetical protein n=1 Tax=Legionella maceachernii TaxID=466 RepID=UPI001A942B15